MGAQLEGMGSLIRILSHETYSISTGAVANLGSDLQSGSQGAQQNLPGTGTGHLPGQQSFPLTKASANEAAIKSLVCIKY